MLVYTRVVQEAPHPIKAPPVRLNAPVAAIVQRTISDSAIKTPPQFINGAFTLEPSKPQYVIMILNKVDQVYINEAKNAFARFNRGTTTTQGLTITRDVLDADRALLLFSTFDNADAALAYYDKIRRAAPSEISWLQPAKYSFLIISEANLQVLKTNKDLQSYRQLLNTNYNNRF